MSTQQITLPINIELDKNQLRTSLRNSILEKSTTDDFRGVIDFMTAILRYTSELVGLSYENFKLTAVSAWEHDETHVRHFSSVNGFCVPKQTIPRYEVRGERSVYHSPDPWTPGRKLDPIPRSASNTLPSWGVDDINNILDYMIKSVLDYIYGKPKKPDAGESIKNWTKLQMERSQLESTCHMSYGIESFIYGLAEMKEEHSFMAEGAIIEIGLLSSGEDYYVTYKGSAYMTEPQLYIESGDYTGISENCYI